MEKLLIANRGEIACRIIQSCRRLGLATVAVYSDADRDAQHVAWADEAVAIGPAPARDSYLNHEAVLAATRQSGATLVHPGYGFLAENAAFAEAVIAAGLNWVGPTPACIRDMGDKERAREIASAAGVPVLPGSRRFTPDDMAGLDEAARQVSFPLLVKAAAGGGGIGMRRVDDPAELAAVVAATQSMAGKAFGSASIYLERYVANARHIEVQVFGLGDGSAVHLYDRECSIQRRFQKIIEEAPAPNLAPAQRDAMRAAAVALAGAQRYGGAGTVEFIYDCDRESFYFLEMNTRIQVEHPVSEMITGIDLVAWQIEFARGWLPAIAQSQIAASGHAIEARLYAERPEKGFLPSPGQITRLVWPAAGAGLRIDTGVRELDRISPYYDPMIGKLVAHAATRQQALDRLTDALAALVMDGLGNNAAFLQQVLRDEDVVNAELTTGFVDRFIARRKQVAA